MTVKDAKNIARKWIYDNADEVPEFRAAFYHGSVNWLNDESVFPYNSDLDMIIISSSEELPAKEKFLYENLLMELTYMSPAPYHSAEQILGNYHLAGNFFRTEIMLDVTGNYTYIQKEVAKQFAERRWVLLRCQDARNNALKFLNAGNETDPVYEQVTGWLFARGALTHILLTAGFENPTVRKRYVSLGKLLSNLKQMDFYELVMEVSGFSSITKTDAEQYLNAVTEIYDAACKYLRSPFAFAADIDPVSRKIAILGSEELISAGLHREAMFRIVATWCRCLHVLFTDAPKEIQLQHKQPFLCMLANLNILSFEDRNRDNVRLLDFIPRVMEMAEWIMDQHQVF